MPLAFRIIWSGSCFLCSDSQTPYKELFLEAFAGDAYQNALQERKKSIGYDNLSDKELINCKCMKERRVRYAYTLVLPRAEQNLRHEVVSHMLSSPVDMSGV